MARKLARPPEKTEILENEERSDSLVAKQDQAKRLAIEKAKARTLAKQQANAERLAAASEELSASIEEANAASALLSEQSGEVAQSADKMSSNANLLQDAANNMNQSVGEVNSVTERYMVKITEMDQKAVDTARTIMELTSSVEATTKRVLDSATMINQLKTKAENISSIVQVVSDIAEQTNLLALNAAIEAARAEEHGKGFAVVADEVRTLAEVSENSAQKIKEVIDGSLEQVEKVVSSVNAFETLSNVNTNKTRIIAQSCEKIRHESAQHSTLVQKITKIAGRVANHTDQSYSNINILVSTSEEISASCEQVRHSTAEQTKAFNEASAAANDLSTMADGLKNSTDLSKSSEELAAAAEQLAATVEEMDHSAGEVEIAIREVDKGAEDLKSNLDEISQVTTTTLTDLEDGEKDLTDIEQSYNHIQDQVEHIKCLDHIFFIDALERAVANNTPFKGQLDPHKCAFGCWYDHHQPDEGDEEKAYNEIREHHEAVHIGAGEIVRAMEDNKLNEAKSILENKVKPAVDNFKTIFRRFNHGIEMVTDGIKGTVNNNHAIMTEVAVLDKEFSKVNKIVDTINNVSIQTNMLAVNGHIEAARAGDFGRGFSVVAGDIRSLANESADNAEKMREILDDMREQIALVKGEINNIDAMIQVQIERANVAVDALVGISMILRETDTIKNQAVTAMGTASTEGKKTKELVEDSEEAVNLLTQNIKESSHAASEQLKGIKEIANTAEDVASLADEMQNG